MQLQNTIEQIVLNVLQEFIGDDLTLVDLKRSFDNFGLDEIDVIELIMGVEDELDPLVQGFINQGIKIPDHAAYIDSDAEQSFTCPNDIVVYAINTIEEYLK